MQAGWRAIGNAQAVAIIQPAPLPADPAELFQRAAAGAGELGQVVGPLLATLWAGEWPAAQSTEVDAFLGEVIFQAGLQAAAEAKAAAAELALAA